jgi:hypothetical protein
LADRKAEAVEAYLAAAEAQAELDSIRDREALQAVWNDDLGLAETRAASLDSALTEVDDNENPLAGIYYQSLSALGLKDREIAQPRPLTQI